MYQSRKIWWKASVIGILGAVIASTACLQAEDVNLSIDTTKTGPAISPSIYGQFIEHLGRCIHDGIWAENRGRSGRWSCPRVPMSK